MGDRQRDDRTSVENGEVREHLPQGVRVGSRLSSLVEGVLPVLLPRTFAPEPVQSDALARLPNRSLPTSLIPSKNRRPVVRIMGTTSRDGASSDYDFPGSSCLS